MAGAQTITNPGVVYTSVSDYRTGMDDAGGELPLGQVVFTFIADEAIQKGHVVRLANASQTSPPTVGVAEAGTDAPQTVIGVARNAAAAAGDLVEVVVLGFALAQGDGSVTAGSWVTYNSAGRVASEATVDATDVVGTLVGRALADDGSQGDLVPVWVMRV